jgi:hypothetical protein
VNLVQRLSEQTTEEERVIALAKSGINQPVIHFLCCGSQVFLSTDEIIFKAIQYKKMLEVCGRNQQRRGRSS